MAIVLSRGMHGMGGAWNLARAQDLKATLDQVTTNDQAKAVGAKAREQLQGLFFGLGVGPTAQGMADYFRPTLDQLDAALARLPFFDGPVDETWSGVPDGARRAIESATITAATLTDSAPPGSLDAMDAANFFQGFSETLRAEIKGIVGAVKEVAGDVLGAVAQGLGIPTWVWWAVGGVAGLYALSKVKAVKELIA